KGPNLAMVTACTTSTHCIGEASKSIRYGEAEVMIAGGAEAVVTELAVGGFASARALSTRNDDPASASRPWDKDRDGFVLGGGAQQVAVNSTKSMTGHLLGAAGAVEAVFTALALRDQVSPPTINLRTPDPACDLDYVPNAARKMPIRIALSNSFGFGGTN